MFNWKKEFDKKEDKMDRMDHLEKDIKRLESEVFEYTMPHLRSSRIEKHEEDINKINNRLSSLERQMKEIKEMLFDQKKVNDLQSILNEWSSEIRKMKS